MVHFLFHFLFHFLWRRESTWRERDGGRTKNEGKEEERKEKRGRRGAGEE